MFDTYSTILVVALVLSIVSLRWRNLLFSLGGALGWIALWAYHSNNPPTGIAQGSVVHEVLMYAYIAVAIAVMFIYFRQRQRGYTGWIPTKREEMESEGRNRPSRRGLMDLDNTEYRAYIKARMTQRRRR